MAVTLLSRPLWLQKVLLLADSLRDQPTKKLADGAITFSVKSSPQQENFNHRPGPYSKASLESGYPKRKKCSLASPWPVARLLEPLPKSMAAFGRIHY